MLRSFLLRSLLVLLFLPACARAQSSIARSQTPPPAAQVLLSPDTPVVTFTLDFPSSEPEHYAISLTFAGTGHYQSNGRLSLDSDISDTFDFDFTVSEATRSRVFGLAAKAGYFQKNLDSHRKDIAFTGKKTLRYTDAVRTGEATYNYSSNPAADELTVLFQNLSTTLEFGHRLDYDRHYQKLAIDQELKRMQEMFKSNGLGELTAIRPVLEQIIADQSIMNISRARAQRLLAPPQ